MGLISYLKEMFNPQPRPPVAPEREAMLKDIESIFGPEGRRGAERLSDTQLRDVILNAQRGQQRL